MAVRPDFKTYGKPALKEMGGYIYEEFLRKLEGNLGVRTYKEMSSNHAVIGAVLYVIETLCTGGAPRIEAADASTEEQEKADFISDCILDMEHTWEQFIKETVRGILVYGWVVHEKLYKIRAGQKDNLHTSSRFDDGKIGWRGFALRPQDSLLRWEFSPEGYPVTMVQLPPTGGTLNFIPLCKCIHARADSSKQNPEGRSLLRNSYVSWFYQKRIQELEAIGVERDLAGMPMVMLPAEYMASDAPSEMKAVYDTLQKMVTRIKRDEQEGILMPSDRDEAGNLLFEFKLLQSAGGRRIDTNPIIIRYDQRIAMTLLADFVLLGHEAVGSFALADSKTSIFARAVDSVRQLIAAELNRGAIPELLRFNGFNTDKIPTLVFPDLETPDLATVGKFLVDMIGAAIIAPDEILEEYVRGLAGLPSKDESSLREAGEEQTDVKEPPTGEEPPIPANEAA